MVTATHTRLVDTASRAARRRLPRAPALALAIVVLVGAVAAWQAHDASTRRVSAAGPGTAETEAQAIFGAVMSPYCPGLLLANCPSPYAEDLRNAVRAELRQGRTASEVEAGLYATFGDRVRASPPARGAGLVAWTFPAVALAATGAWLLTMVGRPRRDDHPAQPPPPADDLECLRRLDDELDEL
jgi:cytochrome c-type biogenesis protein CcmH/NrfF